MASNPLTSGKDMAGPTPSRLFISFSGGETSAFMTRWLQRNNWLGYEDVQVVFANTGQEHEKTLEFVQRCDDEFGWGVVCVEAVVHHGERKGCTHRIVDFASANRDGAVFEEMIKKYGIPNRAYNHCNRELKLNPMKSYMRSLGWQAYDTAIGIRVDEIDRMVKDATKRRIVYPLISHRPTTKPEINAWWASQAFRLELTGFEGNCKWCWKKSLRKHLTLAAHHWDWFDFPDRMERKYGLAGANDDGTPRVFFREHLDTGRLRSLSLIGEYDFATDDNRRYPGTVDGVPLDIAGACSESCDIFSDTD